MLTWLVLHVFDDHRRQVDERPRRHFFENERLVRRAHFLDLVDEAGGDLFAVAIGHHRHPLVRLNVEADADRVSRAGNEVEVKKRWSCSGLLVDAGSALFQSPAWVSETM